MVAAAIIKEPSAAAGLRCCPWREQLAVRKKQKQVVVRKEVKPPVVKSLLNTVAVKKKRFSANHTECR